MTVEDVLMIIDKATEADAMSKREALEWLDGLVADLNVRRDALADEISDDEEDDE